MARIHEILGIEPGETAVFQGSEPMEKRNIRINEVGKVEFQALYTGEWYVINVSTLCYIIDHPESIIRKPRLTEKQIELLKALLLFSFHYLAADMNNSLFAYGDLPERSQFCWYCSFNVLIVGEAKKELLPLAPWDATKPLDIIQTLKDNNVEV